MIQYGGLSPMPNVVAEAAKAAARNIQKAIKNPGVAGVFPILWGQVLFGHFVLGADFVAAELD